jgi:hypothetical protein
MKTKAEKWLMKRYREDSLIQENLKDLSEMCQGYSDQENARLKAVVSKQEELLEKKSSCILHLIKIILRYGSKITLRYWESNYIKDYPNSYKQLESELAKLKAE